MNYQKIYSDIIERARNRVPSGYVERHHIVPVCMGGTDDNDNLVALYPEEHFLVHVLLLKIYKNTKYRYSLAKAVSMMCNVGDTKRVKRKLYGWLKREHALAMSVSQSGEGNSQFGSRWICNLEIEKNLKIPKDQVLPEGWVNGRNKWKIKSSTTKRKENVSGREIEILEYLNSSSSLSEAIRRAGLKTCGGNYATFKNIVLKHGLVEKFRHEKINWDRFDSQANRSDS